MVVEVLFRIGTVGLFSGIDIDHSFEILDTKADFSLVMGLEHRQIDHKVAVEDIGIEIEHYPGTKVDPFKGPLKDVDIFDPITLFQDIITKGLEGMGGGLVVLGSTCDHPLSDGDIIDPPLFKKGYHILYNTGGGDHTPFGKWHLLCPEDDVWLDKDLCIGRQVI